MKKNLRVLLLGFLVQGMWLPWAASGQLNIDRADLCRAKGTCPPGPPGGLSSLNDEFNSADTLGRWQRIFQVEQWGVDHLEVLDVDTVQTGRMVMIPHSSGWFEDRRSTLVFKEVTGNFVISTQVRVDDRNPLDANQVPEAQFSLAGLMIRAPRDVTPATWTAGGENYVFLALGNGNTGGLDLDFQFEVKTTENSRSVLALDIAGASSAEIQIARIGPAVITLRKLPGEDWEVHRRYRRPDLPNTLQAGFVAYTDWNTASSVSTAVHNTRVLNGSPDLVASFEYARFARPQVPAALAGLDFADPFEVSDTDLLTFLGASPAARP